MKNNTQHKFMPFLSLLSKFFPIKETSSINRNHYSRINHYSEMKSKLTTHFKQNAHHNKSNLLIHIKFDDTTLMSSPNGYSANNAIADILLGRLNKITNASVYVFKQTPYEYLMFFYKNMNDDEIENMIHYFKSSLIPFFQKPYETKQGIFYLNFSAGINVLSNSTQPSEIDQHIHNTYLAMKSAKCQYNDIYARYNNHITHDDLGIDLLLNAIKNDQLIVNYQPIIDIKSNAIVSAECFMRCYSPTIGYIPPLAIIPIAEDHNLLDQITFILFEKVLVQYKVWQNQPEFDDLKSISFNVKYTQVINHTFMRNIVAILKKHQVQPSFINLEISNIYLSDNDYYLITTLEKLKQYGFLLSLDDFGIGFSVFKIIEKLPIDFIKIDRTYIQTINSSHNHDSMSSVLISIAKEKGFSVIIEGIENESQLDFIKRNDADFYQGFYKSKPIPPEDFRSFMNSEATRSRLRLI